VLRGSADLEQLAGRVSLMAGFATPGVAFPEAEVLQAGFEMRYSSRQATLPPALHPTTPPTMVVVGWRCPISPWGAFQLVQVRVGCRSGVRPRGLVVGCVVDNIEAARVLAADFGLPARVGDVSLTRHYDRVALTAAIDGRDALDIVGANPEPLGSTDVQYTVTMTMAMTPLGLRLVQLEPEYQTTRVERLHPRLHSFDATAWGEPLLTPVHPVAASLAVASITIPPLRYVCRPDVLAFEGTESVR
jgi:hypothetical protein